MLFICSSLSQVCFYNQPTDFAVQEQNVEFNLHFQIDLSWTSAKILNGFHVSFHSCWSFLLGNDIKSSLEIEILRNNFK